MVSFLGSDNDMDRLDLETWSELQKLPFSPYVEEKVKVGCEIFEHVHQHLCKNHSKNVQVLHELQVTIGLSLPTEPI